MKYCLIALLLAASAACTSNIRSRYYGGVHVEKLPPNRKLVTVSWKETSLWIMTKPMTSADVAEKYELKESSSLGIVQGTVVIEEVKQ